MGFEINDASLWSEEIFGSAELGDKRLTKRLVSIGKQLSSTTGASLSKSCAGDEALLEGSYRFLRNDKVKANKIAESAYESISRLAQASTLLLAIEDTTSIVYGHELSKQLGYTSNKVDAKQKGYQVHSTMLMDGITEKTIGLISQNRWCRERDEYGKRANRVKRLYEEKESYKWEKNSHELASRLGEKIKDTISVCDRDADLYEYVQYKVENNQRFIVRACHDRRLENIEDTLFKHLADASILGDYKIEIAQKSGRKKREVELELRATTVTLVPPKRYNGEDNRLKAITINIVHAKEKIIKSDDYLEWILLTTEKINTFEEARKVTRYYELRWRIEDFHKAWKTGTKVENLRMQSKDNLEKMIVILSFVAIRLLQLKEHFEQDSLSKACDSPHACSELLTEPEWKVLWQTTEKKQLPKNPPSAAWAFKAIAKLGGWTNSKRTGKASWATIWDGWFKLNERVQGFLLAQKLMEANL